MIPGFELSIHNDKSPEKVMHVNVMSRNSTYDLNRMRNSISRIRKMGWHS